MAVTTHDLARALLTLEDVPICILDGNQWEILQRVECVSFISSQVEKRVVYIRLYTTKKEL